jgi:hypothetical protein
MCVQVGGDVSSQYFSYYTGVDEEYSMQGLLIVSGGQQAHPSFGTVVEHVDNREVAWK